MYQTDKKCGSIAFVSRFLKSILVEKTESGNCTKDLRSKLGESVAVGYILGNRYSNLERMFTHESRIRSDAPTPQISSITGSAGKLMISCNYSKETRGDPLDGRRCMRMCIVRKLPKSSS